VLETPLNAPSAQPWMIRPEPGREALPALTSWCRDHRASLHDRLLAHGAVLLRGFDVRTAEDIELVASALRDDLSTEYLGTSPRNLRSRHVFTASELPPHYPIMQHCEMSFLPSAPRWLFFGCTVAPTEGGETPVTDCAAVWESLPMAMQEAFAARGVRIVRNYAAPGARRRLDPWQLKSWPEVFSTTDRADVEATAAREGTVCTWRPDGSLRLERTQPACIRHPETGRTVWFNHCQVFHGAAARLEYTRILAARPSLRSAGVTTLLGALTWLKARTRNPDDWATHCTFGDGGEIPDAWVATLLDAFWRNMVVFPWQQGDVLMIDNARMSHGRLPFRGPREILVAFTQGWAHGG
jgi:alpha-ketoglutarate-dependent taurine dioxygenase